MKNVSFKKSQLFAAAAAVALLTGCDSESDEPKAVQPEQPQVGALYEDMKALVNRPDYRIAGAPLIQNPADMVKVMMPVGVDLAEVIVDALRAENRGADVLLSASPAMRAALKDVVRKGWDIPDFADEAEVVAANDPANAVAYLEFESARAALDGRIEGLVVENPEGYRMRAIQSSDYGEGYFEMIDPTDGQNVYDKVDAYIIEREARMLSGSVSSVSDVVYVHLTDPDVALDGGVPDDVRDMWERAAQYEARRVAEYDLEASPEYIRFSKAQDKIWSLQNSARIRLESDEKKELAAQVLAEFEPRFVEVLLEAAQGQDVEGIEENAGSLARGVIADILSVYGAAVDQNPGKYQGEPSSLVASMAKLVGPSVSHAYRQAYSAQNDEATMRGWCASTWGPANSEYCGGRFGYNYD
ncbi:MAG: hypothetical protein ACRBCT_01195 [Alphaproteobacteria bacterium]